MSTLRLLRSKDRSLPSTRAQAEGLRVDPERRFIPHPKGWTWRRRMGQGNTSPLLVLTFIFLAHIFTPLESPGIYAGDAINRKH